MSQTTLSPYHISEELPYTSNTKQNPTHNHQRRSSRIPRPSTTRTNLRTPTRSLRNPHRRRLNLRKIPHSHIRSIRHAILRRRFPRLTGVLRDRVQADFRRARGLGRGDDDVGGDVRADAAVGCAAVTGRHVDDAGAADGFAVDVPLESGDGADVEIG